MDDSHTLRWLALIEAGTLLALFLVAMPLNRVFGVSQVSAILGPIHGVAFILFLWAVVRALAERQIDGWGALRLVVAAMIPFGGIINERWLRRVLSKREGVHAV